MEKRGIKLFENLGILTYKPLFMQAYIPLSHVHQWLTGSSYHCVEIKKGEEKGKWSYVLKYEHALLLHQSSMSMVSMLVTICVEQQYSTPSQIFIIKMMDCFNISIDANITNPNPKKLTWKLSAIFKRYYCRRDTLRFKILQETSSSFLYSCRALQACYTGFCVEMYRESIWHHG